MKALLKQNKNDATQAEANAIGCNFWRVGITQHYRERAEMLENAFVENGDESSVLVLLEAD